jgi:alpha-glucosidase
MRRLLLLFLAIAHVGPGFSLASLKPGPAIELRSPNGRVMFVVSADAAGRLTYRVVSSGTSVIDRSPIGIVVDGTNLGEGAAIGKVDRYRIREKYPWRGVHAEAVNHANGARIAARHAGSGVDFTIDVRAFDDGIAFRHEVAGTGRRVPDAASGFRLPPGSVVWFHGLRDHYEARATSAYSCGGTATRSATPRSAGRSSRRCTRRAWTA